MFVAVMLASAALALILTPAVRRVAERLGVVDRPGARKIHGRATATLGGLAVVVSAAAGLGAVAVAATQVGDAPGLAADVWAVVADAALVFAVGLYDDVLGVSPAAKLVVEAIAASLVIGAGTAIERVTLAGTTYEATSRPSR